LLWSRSMNYLAPAFCGNFRHPHISDRPNCLVVACPMRRRSSVAQACGTQPRPQRDCRRSAAKAFGSAYTDLPLYVVLWLVVVP
jgi:hypothetical protein